MAVLLHALSRDCVSTGQVMAMAMRAELGLGQRAQEDPTDVVTTN